MMNGSLQKDYYTNVPNLDWTPVSSMYESILLSNNKNDPNAFLFSLVDKDNQPIKLKCKRSEYAIFVVRLFRLHSVVNLIYT